VSTSRGEGRSAGKVSERYQDSSERLFSVHLFPTRIMTMLGSEFLRISSSHDSICSNDCRLPKAWWKKKKFDSNARIFSTASRHKRETRHEHRDNKSSWSTDTIPVLPGASK
jgi:hypothetical protein